MNAMSRTISGHYFADQLSLVIYSIEYFKKLDVRNAISPSYFRKEFHVETETILFLPYADRIRTCSNHSQAKVLIEIRNRATKKLLYKKIYRDGDSKLIYT